jgi:hypothetical protein
MTIAVTDPPNYMLRGTIALLRTGRLPYIKPAKAFSLVPLSKDEGDIAEQTHFFIDYSKEKAVICLEFNNNGPRISDVEFYLRKLANEELGLARSTTVDTYMDGSFEKAIDNLSNVLSFKIKVKPVNLNMLETDMQGYFSGMRMFATQVRPQYLNIEAGFQHQGRKLSVPQNVEANTMIRTLLNRFKKNTTNLDGFENFVIKYEDKFGHEEVLNLLNGKKEFEVEADLASLKSSRDWYRLIEKPFKEFTASL